MGLQEVVQNWLDSAESDHKSALWLFQGAHNPQALYYQSLAIEKVLKAHVALALPEKESPKTHNLRKLLGLANLKISAAQDDLLRDLSRAFRRVRYSDLAQKEFNTKKKTEPLFREAVRIYVWIKQQLQYLNS